MDTANIRTVWFDVHRIGENMMVTVQGMQKDQEALIERLTAHVAELQENRQKLINTHIAAMNGLREAWKAERSALEGRLIKVRADNDAKDEVIEYISATIYEINRQIRGIQ